EPLLKGRWTETRKQLFVSSRVMMTQQLVDFCKRQTIKPEVFISGSAIGYYGAQDNQQLTEESEAHDEFTHYLCKQWEEAAQPVVAMGIRLCWVRTGIVLGKQGGALKEMLLPFQ